MDNISPTLNCQNIINELKKNNRPVYNFGLGANPLKQSTIFSSLVKKYTDKKNYTPVAGIPEFKDVMKDYYKKKNNYDLENIITGNGLKQLLFLIQLAFKGKIIHITPSWVSYYEQVKILNRQDDLIIVDTYQKDNYKINITELEEIFIKYKDERIMLLFNNPNNPTGYCYDKSYIQELSNMIRKYNVVVMADDIYSNVKYDNDIYSISTFLPNQTIIGSSISKDMGCGGYRFGWLTFPKELNDLYGTCNALASSIYSCPNSIIQYACTDYMKNHIDDFNSYIKYSNKIFSENSQKVCECIDGEKTKLRYTTPNSAWYLLLHFGEYKTELELMNIKTSKEITNHLLQCFGIVTVPGEAFQTKELMIRLSLVDFNDDLDISHMLEGIKKICSFCNSL